MKITYIHHSGFLVETRSCYYLFDYESGTLPEMNAAKPIFVLSSHGHSDHFNPEIFSRLSHIGMNTIHPVLSDDIAHTIAGALRVAPGKEYALGPAQKLTTFRSTDLGVAFLIEEEEGLIYHAGDLNDWVWAEETPEYNTQMTENYRKEMDLLAAKLGQREIDTAFVVLDPRQEADFHRGLCYFLENVPVKQVYPMHYWDNPSVIEAFLQEYPQYAAKIQKTQ